MSNLFSNKVHPRKLVTMKELLQTPIIPSKKEQEKEKRKMLAGGVTKRLGA